MPPLWWAWMLFGPALAAVIGVLVGHLAHANRCELLQDRAYEDGWRDSRHLAQVAGDKVPDDYPTVIVHPPAPARHTRPGAVSDGTRAAVAVLAIRSEFDRIRELFGLDTIEGPAPPRGPGRHHVMDSTGPPSGELLRAAGIDPGPPWPIATRRG